MNYVWKSAVHVNEGLPDPSNFGWMKNDEQHEPFMTNNIPVPQSVIELIMCSCKKGWNSMHCNCRKNRLVCSDVSLPKLLKCSRKPEFD